MEVLESIRSYTEITKLNPYLYEDQKEALEILYRYCHNTEPQLKFEEIDRDFFDEFLMHWLPNDQLRLEEGKVDQVLKGVGGYCAYIQATHKPPSLRKYRMLTKDKREYRRIYQLKQLFLKYLGDPIISVNPLIIDLKAYKHYRIRKGTKEKQGVYQEGIFEVTEVDYDYTVVLRKLPKGNFVRIIVPEYIASSMRKGDILHLRIKQKQYFAYWEVEDLRNCYLPSANQYLLN